MGLRVLHKGLILVAVPLALELLIIGLLSYLLYASDHEQAREAERCHLAMTGSRLMFANCNCGNLLIKAFRSQNIHMLDRFAEQCDYIDGLNKEMSRVPKDDPIEDRAIQLKILKAQAAVTARLREIADATSNGFGMGTLRTVLASHKKLVKELDAVFGLLRTRYQALDARLPDSWVYLQKLKTEETLVLYGSLAATVCVSGLLALFYRNQFMRRIDQTKRNVEALTLGGISSKPVAGQDEISDLDLAFRQMSMQLAAVAERERALFENSSDMICVLDKNLNFLRLNKASLRFCGKAPVEFIGKHISSMLQGNSESEIKQIEQRLLSASSSGGASQCETELSLADGSKKTTLWSVFWSPDQNTCHCVVHDVSDERALDKMRESFLRLIAADFREPLTDIAKLVDKLASGESGALPEMATKKIVGATGTLARMVSMVDELLQLETVKSSSLNLNRKTHLVKDTLAETIKDTEAIAQRRGIQVIQECPDDLSFDVDFDRIVRVLTNFISNAIKFSPENGLVKLTATKSNEGEIVVSVIDQGRGIPKDVLGSLFQAFKQVSSADAKRGKGTGLGLLVCKRIVEEHGGKVGVESEEGRGSLFWLSIPSKFSLVPSLNNTNSNALDTISSSQEIINVSQHMPRKSNFWERLSFKQKGLMLVGLPLAFQGLFVLAMMVFMYESNQAFGIQMHNRFITRNALRITPPFFRLLVALRKDDGIESRQKIVDEVEDEVNLRLEKLDESVKGDRMASQHVRLIHSVMRSSLIPLVLRLQDELRLSGGALSEKENQQYANMTVQMIGGLTYYVQSMVDDCERRDKDAPVKLQNLRQFETVALLLALAFNVCTAAWLAVYFSTDVVRRLLVLSDNSQRLAQGVGLNEALSGSDEIAHLDRSFHETADRLALARATESSFLDNANNIICSFDKSGRFVSLNRVAAEKLSIPYESLQDYSLSSLVVPDQRAAFEKFLDAAKEKGEASATEVKIETGEKTADIVWSIMWSTTEQLYFGVGYDITARRDLDRMKQEFLALVTHDLRTPLTTIQGMAILLETDKFGVLPASARACLGEIKREANQILELVNDLLDLSKLEAGELKGDFSKVSISQLLEKTQEYLDSSGVKATISAPNQTLVVVDLDRLSYAIAGLALELFSEAVGSLNLSAETNSTGAIVIISGAKDDSRNYDFSGINNLDASQHSNNKTRRLRLPLCKRLVQMNNAKASASTTTPVLVNLEIQLKESINESEQNQPKVTSIQPQVYR